MKKKYDGKVLKGKYPLPSVKNGGANLGEGKFK